jgi:CcmD family protein
MKNFESLFAAYIIVWAVFFVYHWLTASRVAKLQAEVERLKQLLKL